VNQEPADAAQPAAFAMHAEPAVAGVELLHDSAPIEAEIPAVRANITVRPAKALHAARNARTIWLQVTAYCPCKICCGPGARGLTASGHNVRYNHGRFVAADTRVLPFGTKLIVPGYANGAPVEVIDRGGAIKGHHIDLFFASHEQAKEWGVKWMKVTIVDDHD
jgi:3D (Asp-Asp-Asp) domain-containing protein